MCETAVGESHVTGQRTGGECRSARGSGTRPESRFSGLRNLIRLDAAGSIASSREVARQPPVTLCPSELPGDLIRTGYVH